MLTTINSLLEVVVVFPSYVCTAASAALNGDGYMYIN